MRRFEDVEVTDEEVVDQEPRSAVPAVVVPAPSTAWSRYDILAGLVVLGWAWISKASAFWTHGWLAIDWGDWGDQAYRVKYLATYGLVNWDPEWDRGLPLFQSYQTLPHAAAVALMHLAGATVPRSMMMAVAILLLLYPLSGYFSLRALGVGVPGALLGAALLTDIPAIVAPIRDYSSLFGTALVPLLCWVVLGALGTRKGYLGAVVLGLSVYVHPFASVAAVALLVARLWHDRRVGRRLAAQLGIAALVGAFYWLPLLLSARPRFEDPWNWSVGFEQSVLPKEGLMGLSVGVLACAIVAFGLVRSGRLANSRLTRCALGASALMAVTALAAYFGWLPRQLMETDPVRWLPNLATLMAIAAAPVGDQLWGWARGLPIRAPGGQRIARAAALALLLTAIVVEGATWYGRSYVPVAGAVNYGPQLGAWADAHNLPAHAAIWTSNDDLANSSFVNFGRFQYTGDYVSQRQWTETAPVLQELMQDDVAGMPARSGRFDVIEPYLRMYGVGYVYLPRYAASTPSFLTGALSGHLKKVGDLPGGFMMQVPWQPVQVFSAPARAVEATTLPNVTFLTFDEQRTRDRLVAQYASLAYARTSAPATSTWSGPTHLSVQTQARAGDLLVIPQNWDTVWQARAQGLSLPIRRVGPNFIGVDLTGLRGPVTVEVTHGNYPSWTAAIVLVSLGCSLALVATVADRRSAAAPLYQHLQI